MADRIVKIVRLDVGNSILKQPRLGIPMGPNLRKLFLAFADPRRQFNFKINKHLFAGS